MEWRFSLWVLLVLVKVQIYGCFGCWDEERIALLHLKTSFNHPNGSSLPSWNDNESDCCGWESVKCNITSRRVIKLSLAGTKAYIQGHWYINTSLFLPFEELRSLDISFNYLDGCVENGGFDRLSTLNNLEVLDLSNNNFNDSILPSLTAVSSLKTLYLGTNKFEGSSPIEGLNRLSKLQVLDLGVNQFNKSILQPLGALSSLKKLYLENNMLEGSIEIQDLDALRNLEVLDLSRNSINGSFLQNIGIMSSLRFLSLSHNMLIGSLPTKGLCELKKLQELYLNDNSFNGNLPSCLRNLTSIRSLDISNNRFPIPISFSFLANHSKLEAFASDNNELVLDSKCSTWVPIFQLKLFSVSNCTSNKPMDGFGDLFYFLYNQYNLRVIDLSHNNLKGEFPNWLLENNTQLESLVLKDNAFKGTLHLPSHPLTDLLNLDVSKNLLSSRIPTNFSMILPKLEFLIMSKNHFEGSIPFSLGDMRSLSVLDLSNNNLSGDITLENFTIGSFDLMLLKLSNNNLQGQIFPIVSKLTQSIGLYLDGNHFTGNFPNSFSNMSNSMEELVLSNNDIFGKLPLWIGNMSNLLSLQISANHLHGPIPVDFCIHASLSSLDLSENNLSGSIPSSCLNSKQMIYLHLQKNRLTGPIFSVGSGSSLVTLDISYNLLTGSIPKWFGKLTKLRILLLKRNLLEGNIPIELCKLPMISIIDLSQNNLSGTIPSCLKTITLNKIGDEDNMFSRIFDGAGYGFPNPYKSRAKDLEGIDSPDGEPLTKDYLYDTIVVEDQVEFTTKKRSDIFKSTVLRYLSGIDLSCNQLSGHIPLEIGNLSEIHALNLSHNHLSGPIPAILSNLRNIESLDLSYNNLSGAIPSQLIELTKLAIFDVAHNNLSGRLPERTAQFGTFEASVYEGNPLLCGPPLVMTCTTNGKPSSMPIDLSEEGQDNGFVDMIIFYWSFATSYITTLLGFFAVLYINPNWRRRWFHLIDLGIYSCYYFVLDNLP